MKTIKLASTFVLLAAAGAASAAPDRMFDLSRLTQGSLREAPAVNGASRSELQERMLSCLDFIRSVFKAGYAPAGWKARYAGWSLDREIAKAKAEVRADKKLGLKGFQAIVQRLINSTQDYHVSASFSHSEAASLPFKVLESGGRFYIVWIDRSKLPESSFPFQAGDELVEFGGRRTADVVKTLQASMGKGAELTDKTLAALRLTLRMAAAGMDVPKDAVTIMVRRGQTGEIATHQLAWDYTPESVLFEPARKLVSSSPFWARSDDMLSPIYRQMLEAGNPFGVGKRRSFVPDLGEKIWESLDTAPFHAYIYRSPEGRSIGYVRIPSYMPEDADASVKYFGQLMAKFDRTTDALVIDQVSNPGGGIFYLYALASTLSSGKALTTPHHRVAITQSDAAQAAEFLQLDGRITDDEDARKVLGPSLNGYPVSYQVFRFIIEYSRFIVSEWNSGRRPTAPTHLYGVDEINPSQNPYTKPILVLINELDFSGGDFFPAILQDNKRAKFLGTRTAGAGGFVQQVQYPNLLGIEGFSVTGSIAERADGNPIENLGVKPDIEYAMTAADFANGLKDYVKAVNQAVGGLAK
ncbi:MAG: protease-like activity factor CPAF [Elusimicrobia bacterium]|nr:protease-like activity factor CPAF [Elusimicrobiota bacterium]